MQLPGIGAVPATHHQHDIHAARDVHRLALALLGGGADGAAYVQIGDALAEPLEQVLDLPDLGRGLRDRDGARDFARRGEILFTRKRPPHAAGPAQDPLNLRVGLVADDVYRYALFAGFFGDCMNALYKGTGFVYHMRGARLEPVDHVAADAVGADHDRGAERKLFGGREGHRAARPERGHNLRIVDDLAQRVDRAARREQPFELVDGASNAEAKARVLSRQDSPHTHIPSCNRFYWLNNSVREPQFLPHFALFMNV